LLNYKPHITRLLKRLGLVLLLYTLCRYFFYLFNRKHFPETGLGELIWLHISGLRFDISAVCILNLPFILLSILPFPFLAKKGYQGLLKVFFCLVNSVGLAFNCIDMGYYPFTFRRLGWDFFGTILHSSNVASPWSYLRGYWYIVLIFAFLVWLLLYAVRKLDQKQSLTPPSYSGQAAWLYHLLFFALLTGGAVLGIRGGWQLVPISNASAGEYSDARYSPIVLNSVFSIANTFGKKGLPSVKYLPENERQQLFNPIQASGKNRFTGKTNVVIIILESFSKEFTALSNQKSITPFLDSLMRESYVFTRAYANGKSSAEGIPAILASVPSLTQEAYPFSIYSTSEVTSLPSLLKPLGYNTSFFHGGTNGTMNFESFTGLAGFDKYYGRTEYNNEADYDGNWGIWDEPFLQYFAHKLGETKEPFFSSVFTLSSHDPFRIPEKYENLFPHSPRTIDPCIEYADFSLRRFFETVKHAPWFSHTLFVLTPDHTAYSDDAYWDNPVGRYSIPIFFYTPDGSLKGTDTTLMQQIDILPTLLSLLGYEKPYFSFGRNAFDRSQEHFAVNFRQDLYQLYEKDYLLQYDGQKTKGFYKLKPDSMLQHNLSAHPGEEQRRMEKFLQAFLQTYQQSLANNKMVLKKTQ
jgi:phosphoglycerol transferase MdoB-like AlkP superfamily enzyme